MTSIQDDFAAAIGALPRDEALAKARAFIGDWGPEVTDLGDVPALVTDLVVENIAVEAGVLTVTGSASILVPGVQHLGDALAADTVRPLYERGVTEVSPDIAKDVQHVLLSGVSAPYIFDDEVVEERLVERMESAGFLSRHGVQSVHLSLFFDEEAVSTGVAMRDAVQERLQRELNLMHSAE